MPKLFILFAGIPKRQQESCCWWCWDEQCCVHVQMCWFYSNCERKNQFNCNGFLQKVCSCVWFPCVICWICQLSICSNAGTVWFYGFCCFWFIWRKKNCFHKNCFICLGHWCCAHNYYWQNWWVPDVLEWSITECVNCQFQIFWDECPYPHCFWWLCKFFCCHVSQFYLTRNLTEIYYCEIFVSDWTCHSWTIQDNSKQEWTHHYCGWEFGLDCLLAGSLCPLLILCTRLPSFPVFGLIRTRWCCDNQGTL